jgi:membrane-bound lytic murein transglycosylase
MSIHRESDIDRAEVSSRVSEKLREKNQVSIRQESDIDRKEISSRPSEKLRDKDATSTHSVHSEREQDIQTRRETSETSAKNKKKSQSSSSVAEQDVVVSASKPSSRGKSKKKASSRTVRLADTERPEIAYVKFDPSSKIIESKIKQNGAHPIEGTKEENVEVRAAPPSSTRRNKVVAVPSVVEGEDSATSEPVLHDPMHSRKRQEVVSREVSAGVDSDDRTEIPKIKITFD